MLLPLLLPLSSDWSKGAAVAGFDFLLFCHEDEFIMSLHWCLSKNWTRDKVSCCSPQRSHDILRTFFDMLTGVPEGVFCLFCLFFSVSTRQVVQ